MKTFLQTILFSSILFLTLTKSASAQGWELVYGAAVDFSGLESIRTPDGGFAVLSSTTNANATTGRSKGYSLIKTDANGQLQWTHDVVDDQLDHETLSFDQLQDGGYVVVGAYTTPGNEEGGYVRRIDAFGNEIWTNLYTDGGISDFLDVIISDRNDGFILLGHFGDNDEPRLIKIRNDGTLSWNDRILPNQGLLARKIIYTDDDNIIIIGDRATAGGTIFKYNRVDRFVIWEERLGPRPNGEDIAPTDVFQTRDGGYIIAATTVNFSTGVVNTKVIKLDAFGQLEWDWNYEEPNVRTGAVSVVQLEFEDSYAVVVFEDKNNDDEEDFRLFRLDENGNEIGRLELGTNKQDFARDILNSGDGGFVLTGGSANFSSQLSTFVIKTNELGQVINNKIIGRVYSDSNKDCTSTQGEVGLANRILEVNNQFYTTTDDQGHYEFTVGSGEHIVRVLEYNPYVSNCQDSFVVNTVTPYDTVLLDIPERKEIECPDLQVDISTNLLRRCFDNVYYVSYRNEGTQMAEDARLEVELDPCFTYLSSTIPLSNQNGQTLTYQLGDIQPDSSAYFQIKFNLDCTCAFLGQTHCTTAHIFPDSICLLPSPNWDGASIELDGQCLGDSLEFKITNTGADMLTSLEYVIIENDVAIRSGNFLLTAANGNERSVFVKANGRTFRMEAMQSSDHPGRSQPSFTIEGCNGQDNTGFVNLFSQNDGDPYLSVDCQQNRGSFDPNDKLAFPEGVTEDNCIAPNTDIEYLIRFQNTGTDTAFRVRIVDTLSQWLNISSIEAGASSHPYEWTVSESGTLTFLFDPIALPDSTVNQEASNGFVKFKIAQTEAVPLGTRIENRASIYFDFNKPIQTPLIFHTIDDQCITVSVNTLVDSKTNNLLVYPNPFHQQTMFEVRDEQVPSFELKLYDSLGRLLRQEQSTGRQMIFDKGNLLPGLYFFEVTNEGHSLGTGKIQVH